MQATAVEFPPSFSRAEPGNHYYQTVLASLAMPASQNGDIEFAVSGLRLDLRGRNRAPCRLLLCVSNAGTDEQQN